MIRPELGFLGLLDHYEFERPSVCHQSPLESIVCEFSSRKSDLCEHFNLTVARAVNSEGGLPAGYVENRNLRHLNELEVGNIFTYDIMAKYS